MEEQNKVTQRWSKTAVTDIGTAMLAEFAAGRILEITAAYGSAGTGGNLTELAELPDGRAHPLTIESVTRTDNNVTACIQVTSLGNPEAYKMDLIGLYAVTKDPGEQREPGEPGGGMWGDRLLMVIEDTEDEQGRKGVTIPAETDQLYTFKLYAVLTITNKDRLEISVSTAGIATMGAIDDAMERHNKDPEAHPGLMGEAFGAHNTDQEAHPATVARVRGLELAMNGKETIAREGDPTSETEGAKGQHYINTKTGMEWECTGVTESGYTWEQVDYDSEKFKSLRDVLAETAATAAQAKEVADGAAKAIAAVQNTISVIPSQSGSLTYNGSAQKPSWNNLALEMMTIAYGEEKTAAEDYTGETDAGTYKAYITPKEGYTWGDKSADEKEVPWTIGRATVTTAPSVAGKLTYTGEAQTPTWQGFDPDKLTKTETAQTDAGDYSTSFAPTKNYQWSGGDTSARVVQWTIERAAIASVPEQSGSLTYTGSAQSPTWTGYDSAKLTIGGNTNGTNAGSYTASFTPTRNYKWSDGTTTAKTAGWSIGKAAGSLALDKTSMTLNASAKFSTITVTRAGDGAISARSSAPGVATVSVSENTVLVTAVKDGSATVTIEVAEGTNHTAPGSKTCKVQVDIPHIYGVSWDGSSTTKWTRTDEAAGFTDPVPYTAGKTAAQCSSPFDNLQPWAGMVKSSRTGGVMVAIPKFWYKLTKNGNGLKIQIATKATAGFSVSPAHMNRSDGKGERDVVYIGRYHCGSNFKSNSGQTPKLNVTRANFRTSIHALGANIWQADFALRFTLWLLYLVEFADWNTQKTIGKGCGNNSAAQNMGYTDSMPYHTGTTQSNRDTYGLGTQYRNIEGLWDNCYDFCDGCYNNSNGLNIILNPNNFSDTSGGVSVGTPTHGWPSAFNVVNQAGFPMIIPSASNGGENVASCDYWGFSTSSPVIFVGGNYFQSGSRGLFYVDYTSATYSVVNLGSRLQELP